MNISFVIPNFNGEKLLEKNLPKVLSIAENYTKGTVEIIVSDDSSKDNSVGWMQSFIQRHSASKVPVLLLENKSGKNRGFSTNVDKGVDHAKGDIVILLNTDVVPNDDFLLPLLRHFVGETVFAVGCMDESIEGGKVVLRGRGKGEWRRGFLNHFAADVNGGTTTLWVGGGSGAFRKSIWQRIGGLNELYNPFYWEDIDLSYKAQKAGYKVIFEKKSVVRHLHEEGSIKKNYSSYSVQKTAYRNQFFFTWLNATDTILIIAHLFFLPYFILQAVKRKDRAFLVGLLSAVSFLPRVWREREKVQRLVQKSDKQVIHQLSQ